MSIDLSDDIRQAVEARGTPLRLIDAATGEAYILMRESALAGMEQSVSELSLRPPQISNHRLIEIAKKNRPPAAWLEGDSEELF